MSNKAEHIFSNKECLSVEDLLAYNEGKLNSLEQHKVEKHLLECELCSDALEGFQLHTNSAIIPEVITELNNRIEEQFFQEKNDTKIKVMFPWQMAAAFALLILSGLTLWFFLPKNNSEKLFTQEYKPIKIEVANKIETQPINLTNKIVAENDKSNLTNIINPKKSVSSENEIQNEASQPAISTITKNDNNASDEIVSEKSDNNKSIDQVISEQPIAIAAESKYQREETTTVFSKDANLTKESARVQMKKEGKSRDLDNYQMGIEAYQAGNYELAIKYFDVETNNQNSIFYSGISYLSLNKPAITINKMQVFRSYGKQELTEDSWWYEALANLKLDDKKSAEKCLREVVKFNGKYKAKSEQLIQKL